MLKALDSTDSTYLAGVYKSRWQSAILSWFSSTQSTQPSDSHMPDRWDGLIYDSGGVEMEKLGADVAYTGSEDLQNNPYSARLRPLTDYSFLKAAKNIMIVKCVFSAFDATKVGSSHQTTAVNTALSDSLSNVNNAYIQSRFLNDMPVTWMPNLFRPIVKIGGTNIFRELKLSAFGDNNNNEGDLGIGWPLPFEFHKYEMFNDPIDTIDVEAAVGQFIDVSGTLYCKRYPVRMDMVVTYQKK